ncbi:hypothetical protein M0805_006468 [Coniferiporia weirii]|nr:hypothetical protein M0805_006468 [Coniferiporia weirii]
MATNLTIDDTSLDIIYSDDWATQSDDDPDVDHFFQSTYHSAQANGSSANLTFTGSAIYIYGTKGPEHANYSVQFDNFIIFYSAMAEETQYQEPLFAYSFNGSGDHFVSLTSHAVSGGQWLDLDYITITIDENNGNSSGPSAAPTTSSRTASLTMTPPWLLALSGSASASSSSTGSAINPSSPSSRSSSSEPALALSITFGTILGVVFIIGLGFYVIRRKRAWVAPGNGATFDYKLAPAPSGSLLSPPLYPERAEPSVYDTQSPSGADPFYRNPASANEQLHDGRRSPWSAFSQGGTTILTAASTTHLLKSHGQKTSQTDLQMRTLDPTSQLGTRPHAQIPQPAGLGTQPVSRPLPVPAQSASRPLPQPTPLRANHANTPAPAAAAQADEPPKRPKRPADNLLGWLGNGISLERSNSAKRRRHDGNSERTDFLQV